MRKFISAFIVCVVMTITFFPALMLRADDTINLSIVSDTDSVNKGDILVVNLVADKMPNIVGFSNIAINYDDVSLTYETSTISNQLPDSFAVRIEANDDNTILVAGEDETVQDALKESMMSEDTEEEIEKEDIAFNSNGEVVLCTLYFRVKAAAYDFVSFSIDEGAEFTNSSFEQIPVAANPAFNFQVTSDVSTDARIVSLKVNGTALADFKPDSYIYALNVVKDVNYLDLEIEPGNIFSSITCSDLNLAFGDNLITIDVVAQDSVTSIQYKLVVNRQSSYLQEGANFMDKKGRIFSFVSAPADIVVPDGFFETTTYINNFEVPCYRSEGVRQVLIYVFDGEGNTGLFFYDPYDFTISKYDPETTIIRKSLVLNIVDVPKKVEIPESFIPAKFVYNGREYNGYVNPEGEVICYLQNESGKKMFYTYDYSSQTFIKYKAVDTRPEVMYKLLFNLCLGISIIEAMVIIFVVYFVRRFRKERINPRPRRV